MAASPTLTTPSHCPPSPRPHNTNNDNDAVVVVSLTASIARSARRGHLSAAVSTFSLMLSSPTTQPNHITLLTLLSACSSPSAAPLGHSLHAHLLKRYPLSASSDLAALQLNTALLDFYAKTGRPHLARQVFDRMPVRNSFTFNSMIAGYMRSRHVDHAVALFRAMRPSDRDKVSWTALIDGFVKNGLLEEALQHFREMQLQLTAHRIEPDYVLVLAVVAACADLGSLGQGMWVHRYAMSRGLCSNTRLANSLIDMYSRCGRVDLARQVFDGVDGKRRTRVTWNSMIVGYAINGYCREALVRLDEMPMAGFDPDGVTFTGALTACSHAGLVDEGLKYFRLMQERHSKVRMRIEHLGCMVDMLGRAGRLEEAMGLVESMTPVMGPNEVVLGSLLAACRMHGDVGLAERLVRYLVELEPDADSNFVLLSNIYASVGRWDGAGRVRGAMKSFGIRKSPGCSAVEVEGHLHEFVSGDTGHMQSEDIYDMLRLLGFEMSGLIHRDDDDSIVTIQF